MAQQIKKTQEVAIKDDFQVSYQSNGQDITLNKAVVMQLTNNNEYITDDEIVLFMNLCKYQGLNPFIREAYLVKYDEKKPAQQVTSLGAFMRIAEEQPTFEGIEDGIIVQNTKTQAIMDRVGCVLYPNEVLIGGWAKVYRSDRKIPSVARLSLKEYTKGQATWNQMPSTMINKCSKVAALRKAYPRAYQGMYEEDEMKATVSPEINIPEADVKVYDVEINETPTDIPAQENIVVEDIIVSEGIIPEENNVSDTNVANIEDEEGVEYIDYDAEYKNNRDQYIRCPYPDGRDPFDKETRKIRVKRKV